MSWRFYTAIGLSFVTLGWMAYAWLRRNHPGARWFMLFAASVLLWNISWIVRALFPSTLFPVLALINISVLTIPPLAARLVPIFTGHEISRRLSRLLYAYLTAIVVGVLTNEWHHGFWRPFASSPLGVHGPLFFLGVLIDYLIIVAGILAYLFHAWRAYGLYRRQAVLVLVSTFLPVTGSVAYFAGVPQGDKITWIAVNITLSMIGIGVFHMRLPEILPIVTPVVLDRLGDGLVIASPSGRLLYTNPKARQLLMVNTEPVDSLATLNHPLAPHLMMWLQTGSGPSRVTLPTENGEQTVEIVFYALQMAPNRKQAGVFLLRDITHQARLEREREIRTRYMETIARIDQYLLTVRQVNGLAPVLQHIGEALGADRVYAFEHVRGAGGALAARLFYQYTRPSVSAFPLKTFVYETVGLDRWLKELTAGRIISGPVKTFPAPERKWLESQKVASVIVVPILVSQRLVGFIAADHVIEQRLWSEAEEQFLLSVASSIRSTLERLNREASLEAQNRFLAHLNTVIQAAATAASLDQFLPLLADEFRKAFSATACYLFLWKTEAHNGEPSGFHIVARAHAGDTVVDNEPSLPPVLRRLITTCMTAEMAFLLPGPDGNDLVWLAIPLKDREEQRAIGGVFLALTDVGYEPSSELIRRANEFAWQITLAINRVKLYDQLQKQNRRLNTLYAVGASIVSLDPDEVLKHALDAVLRELGWEAGWILVPDPVEMGDGLPRLAAAKNVPPSVREFITRYPIRDCRACSLLYRYPNLKALLSVDECVHLRRDLLTQAGLHQVVGIPLRGTQKTLGILFVARSSASRPFEEDMRDLFFLLGQHIGTALENAHFHAFVREQAIRDTLTGVYNRRFLVEQLDRLFNMSRRTSRPISALIVDIDHFKRFNDRYGHLEGDMVLRTVAHVIEANVRGVDIVVRYGGEEFVVILPETDRKEASLVAERVRRAVEEYPFRHYLFTDAQPITISVGVATAPYDATTPEDLLNAADQALYAAKEAGRNLVMVYRELKAS